MELRALPMLAMALLPGLIGLAGALRGVDVYAALTDGARDGLTLLARLGPSLAVLLPAGFILLQPASSREASVKVISSELSIFSIITLRVRDGFVIFENIGTSSCARFDL